MYPCPACQGQIIGMDTIYTQGVCMFCQHCGARPDRVSVTRDVAHADIEALAKAAWNEWAETELLAKLTLPEGGYINDTRLSG